MQHLHPLTSLRFFAALVVVLFHYGRAQFQGIPLAQSIVDNGFVGVQLFFVLSGFILAYTYYRREGWTPMQFWRARFARIYPGYFVAMLLALPIFIGVVLRDGHGWGYAALTTALTTTLLQAWVPQSACALNCPGWSLSVEAFFYALFPLLALALRPLRLRWNLVVAAVAAGLLLVPPTVSLLSDPALMNADSMTKSLWLEVLKYNPLFHFGEFVVGLAIGGIFLRSRRISWGNWLALMGLAVSVVIVASGEVPYPLLHNGLLALPFAALIYGLAHASGWLARFAANPTLILLGEASFGLYILHAPIYTYSKILLARLGIHSDSWLFLALYLLVLTVASILAYKHLETPARRWLTRRKQAAPAVT